MNTFADNCKNSTNILKLRYHGSGRIETKFYCKNQNLTSLVKCCLDLIDQIFHAV